MSFSKLPANATTRFPASAALDPSQWDLSGLDSTATQFTINYIRNPNFDIPRPMVSGWVGDTWKVLRSLTLNLGVRYDVAWSDLSPPRVTPTSIPITTGYAPFGTEDVGFRNSVRDLHDVAPRLGVAWSPRRRPRHPRRERHSTSHEYPSKPPISSFLTARTSSR